MSFGEVSGRLKELVSKTSVRATVPGVRIPPSPFYSTTLLAARRRFAAPGVPAVNLRTDARTRSPRSRQCLNRRPGRTIDQGSTFHAAANSATRQRRFATTAHAGRGRIGRCPDSRAVPPGGCPARRRAVIILVVAIRSYRLAAAATQVRLAMHRENEKQIGLSELSRVDVKVTQRDPLTLRCLKCGHEWIGSLGSRLVLPPLYWQCSNGCNVPNSGAK